MGSMAGISSAGVAQLLAQYGPNEIKEAPAGILVQLAHALIAPALAVSPPKSATTMSVFMR